MKVADDMRIYEFGALSGPQNYLETPGRDPTKAFFKGLNMGYLVGVLGCIGFRV